MRSISTRADFSLNRLVCQIGFVLLAMFFPILMAQAQDSATQVGAPTFTTADPLPGGLGFINVANGNAHIEIPIGGSYPQRGDSPYAAEMIYDSRQWWGGAGFGWDFGTGNGIQGGWSLMTSKDAGFADDNGGVGNGTEIDWTAPDNTYHQFFTVLQPGSPMTWSGYCADGSGMQAVATQTSNGVSIKIIEKDGTVIVPTSIGPPSYTGYGTSTLEDSNGNFYFGNTTRQEITPIDTLGRQPITVSLVPNTFFPPPYVPPSSFGVLNSENVYTKVQAVWSIIPVHTNFQVTGAPEADFEIEVLASLTLPDGSSYQFTYDCDSSTGDPACNSPAGQAGYYGLLTGITLPTGGTVSLSYGNFTDANGNTARWVTGRSATGEGNWTYTPATGCVTGGSSCQTLTETQPSGDQRVYTFSLNLAENAAWNTMVQYYSGSASGTPLMTITNNYTSSELPPFTDGFGFVTPKTSTVAVPVPGGTLVKETDFGYDTFTYTYSGASYTGTTGKLLSRSDYGYSSSGKQLLRKTVYSYLDDANPAYKSVNIIDRPTDIQIQNSEGTVAETKIYYDSTPLTSVIGVINHDDTNYGAGNTLRGNPTQIQQMVSPGNFISTSLQYDTTGQLVKATDPIGNVASLGYGDNFFSDSNPPQNPPQPHTPTAPTNAYVTTVNLPLGDTASLGYYYGTGQNASSIDENGAASYLHYLDPLDRLTHTYLPPTNGYREWILSAYAPSNTQVDVYTGIDDTEPSTDCVSCRHDLKILNGLGQPTQSVLASDPDGATTVAQSYDSSGRVSTISNPYRATTDPTYGIDTAAYDGLNRVTQIQHPDGNLAHEFYGANVAAGGGAPSQLCGNVGLGYPVLIVDETGRKGQTWTDALGRTIETDQPDSNGSLSVGTCYSYDALDNLTSVVQGSQTRSYMYDALSRIIQETPVESATAYASYTSSGGLCSGDPNEPCSVTDARKITTTFTYDALNRLTSKTYSDNTPAITYYYDQNSFNCLTITNGKGRRTGMTDGSGTTAWSYDAAGNVLTEQRSIGNVTETTSYTYNLDGSVASITYPSDRTVVYNYSNAQRPLSAVDPVNGINYATGATYSPLGALASVIYGKASNFQGITQTYGYNNRMELTALNAASPTASALNLSFNYSQPSGNNGNVASITNGLDSTRTQNFAYDPLNRIQSAQTQSATGPNCWGLQFAPDPVGNLLSESVNLCSALPLSVSTDGNNHLIGFGYDAAGNMTADGIYIYKYDGEGRLSQAGSTAYTYDGDDLRVEKSSGILYWRSISGDALAESNSGGAMTNEYVFFGGGRIARVQDNMQPTPDSVYYYFTDQLGSTRAITDSSGNVCYQADFYPYGGEVDPAGVTNTCPQNYLFAGYERDPETGLDYAMARYYENRIGRFTSPDPLDGSPEDSQSWNAYAYTSNDPINSIDPSGMQTQQNQPPVDLNAVISFEADGGYGDPVFDSGITYGEPFAAEAGIAGFSGPFDGGGGAAGIGAAGPGLAAVLAWTPYGYGCPGGCNILPPTPSAFSPPSFSTASFQAGQQSNASASGINPNYKIPIFDLLLKKISDFSAGAGDALTGRMIPGVHTSFTQYIRRRMGTDSVVSKNSLTYKAGDITGGTVGWTLVGAGSATVAAVANGKYGALFGRGLETVFNSSDTIRFGWGWEGSANSGRDVIRLGIGAARGTSWWSHIAFWYP